jgi:hypothetical protein
MCNKCIKRAFGREIVNIESKLDILFKKMEASPSEYKHDESFISLVNCMSALIKKYEKIKEV